MGGRVAGWLLAATVLTAPMMAAAAPPAAPPAPTDPLERELLASKMAMMAEPKAAFEHASAAAALAGRAPAGDGRDLGLAKSQWLEGEALVRLKRPKEAPPLLNQALAVAERLTPAGKLRGDILKSRGRAYAALGEVQKALADYHEAFRIYQKAGEPRGEAMALQEIGSVYADARDSQHMLQYYAQSSEVYGADPTLALTAHNNQGIALRDLGRGEQAETEFRLALKAAEQLNSGLLQAQILNNIASAEDLQHNAEEARTAALQGLALTARDPEARVERPFLQGTLAKIEADRGDVARAATLLDQAFAGVNLATTTMDWRDFHEIAARVYERTGREALALAHMKAFKRLDDQGRQLAASTNSALMAAQFDFANQDLKIARLKAGQLQRDIDLAQARGRMHNMIFGGLLIAIGGVLLATLLGFISMRRSRDRIRAANDQLGISNTALEKALKAKTEFLATTSHEIRTPLNGILGMTQVILADRDVSASVKERLQLVQGAGETMKSLVDDLLDVAKVETGAISLNPAAFDLHRVLADTIAFWSGQAQAKGLALTLEDAEAPRRIEADESRIRQVLYNLMSNALKFTDTGAVTLNAAAEGETLVLRVHDTGIGIPAVEHERIFEAFTQVDGGTARKYGGTGLGLSICRAIVDAMGGAIAVESCEGEGATFTVRLPLVRVEAPALQDAAPAVSLATADVLVIEPNPLAQGMLKAVLEPACRSLAFAQGAAQAEELLAAARADLILADAPALLVGDGPAAAVSALCAGAPHAHLACTVPAALAAETQRLAEAGVQTVILKPVSAAELSARLNAALAAAGADQPAAGVAAAA